MKRFKKFASLLMAAALFTLLFNANALQVSADGPTTYHVKYVKTLEEWRWQKGTWNDESEGRELYYLNNGDEKMKDGDILVVSTDDDEFHGDPIKVDVRLSNLTILKSGAVVHAKSIDECFVLANSISAINGDVKTAYVYDNPVCTFNNNIDTLKICRLDNAVMAKLTVAGTVNHLIACEKENLDDIYYEYYNVAAGKLEYDGYGHFMTDPQYYSTTPTGGTAKPAQNTGSSSGAYDNVPKTGERNTLLWLLLGASALCMAGGLALRKNR